jgi:hypothetical protein
MSGRRGRNPLPFVVDAFRAPAAPPGAAPFLISDSDPLDFSMVACPTIVPASGASFAVAYNNGLNGFGDGGNAFARFVSGLDVVSSAATVGLGTQNVPASANREQSFAPLTNGGFVFFGSTHGPWGV